MRIAMRTLTAAGLGLVLGVAACNDEQLAPPPNQVLADPMFARYVSMGNSITAGFQSGGLNATTQNQSYAVLLADAMGTNFYTPLMNLPGCPPLYSNVFTQTRVPGPPCALRQTPAVPPPFINNVAVPGAEVIDIYSNLDPTANANALTSFFLGGLTQVEMMQRVAPTFVSVWIGNNDILGAALAGDTNRLTPVATFQTNYSQVLDAIDAVGAQAALVAVGLGDTFPLPYWSRGTTYFAIKAGLVPGAAFPPTFTVDASCAPPRGDSVWVSFPVGGVLIGTAAAGGSTTLDCTNAAQALQPATVLKLLTTGAAYNTFIAAQAQARGWLFVNMSPTFNALRATAGAVMAFPLLGQPCSANPFGTAFSCDGIHPSASSHRAMAGVLRDAINTEYGTNIPAIP